MNTKRSFRFWFWRIWSAVMVLSLMLCVAIYGGQIALATCCGDSVTAKQQRISDGLVLLTWLVLSTVLLAFVWKKISVLARKE